MTLDQINELLSLLRDNNTELRATNAFLANIESCMAAIEAKLDRPLYKVRFGPPVWPPVSPDATRHLADRCPYCKETYYPAGVCPRNGMTMQECQRHIRPGVLPSAGHSSGERERRVRRYPEQEEILAEQSRKLPGGP